MKLRPTRVLHRFAVPTFNLFNYTDYVYNILNKSNERKFDNKISTNFEYFIPWNVAVSHCMLPNVSRQGGTLETSVITYPLTQCHNPEERKTNRRRCESLTRQVINVWRNIKVRSRNHFCSGKAKTLHIMSVCVCSLSYPACKSHAPCYTVVCGLFGCTIFFHIISKTARFFGKRLVNIKCMFWYFIQLLPKTFSF